MTRKKFLKNAKVNNKLNSSNECYSNMTHRYDVESANQPLKVELEIYPIFPISNTVFFPKTVIPLHIFEPRYKK